MERRLYVLQRITAMLLAPLVVTHLGLIIVAVRGGLSASEILARTQGNAAWLVFYSAFVLAAAIHAPIGVRSILLEWSNLPRRLIDICSLMLAVILIVSGIRAAAAVY